MRQLSQLGEGDFAGESVVGDIEPAEAAEMGNPVWEHAGEEVVGEVEVLEVGPSGEAPGGGGEAVVVEAEVAKVGEASEWLDRPGEVERVENEFRDSASRGVAGDAQP